MSDYFDPLEQAFNDALEESASGLGYGGDPFELEGPGDGFDPFDTEGDAFFGKAFKSLGNLVKKLPLRQLAPIAGRIAGGAIGGPIGAQLGGMAAGMLGEDHLDGLDGFDSLDGLDGLDGFDSEASFETESGLLQEDAPQAFGLDSFTDSLAESLATQAAASESDSESSALLGGVTIHIVTGAPVAVRRMSPILVRSAGRLGRYLRKRPRTRPLVKAIPTIQKQAVKMLTKHAQQGGKVTPAVAAKAMAKATVKTLGTPTAAAKSLANNAVKARRVGRPSATGPSRRSIARAER